MMNEVTLDELEVGGDSHDPWLVLRTTIRFDDGEERPRRRAGPSVDTAVRAAIPGIVGEMFDGERPPGGIEEA